MLQRHPTPSALRQDPPNWRVLLYCHEQPFLINASQKMLNMMIGADDVSAKTSTIILSLNLWEPFF